MVDRVYNQYFARELSRADFYVLAAQAGIEIAVKKANEVRSPPGGQVPMVSTYRS